MIPVLSLTIRRVASALLASALVAAAPLAPDALLSASLAAQERHVLTGGSAAIWNLAGEIRLEPGTGDDVVVEVTRGGAGGARLDIVASGGQLRIRYPDDDIVYRHRRDSRRATTVNVRSDGSFSGEWGSGGRRTDIRTNGSGLEAHADLVVKVPAGRRVEVYLAVGQVEATDIVADVRFDVRSADVRLSGTNGSVIVETGSGSIDGRDVTAERFSAEAGSGNVTVDGLTTSDLTVDTGSGSVRIALTQVPGRSEFDTGSGSVTLTLPQGASVDLDIETGSGGISSDFPVTMDQMRRRALRGRIGEGGPILRASTGSGGVRLLKP